MSEKLDELPSQNVFNFGRVTFSSNFDNGNLARVKKIDLGLPYQYKVWVAVDNEGGVILLCKAVRQHNRYQTSAVTRYDNRRY
jgi:hypothetical protein